MTAQKLILALKHEFSEDANKRAQLRIESIYTQLLQISGPPLRDSYHFGQTIVNNYGRPYEMARIRLPAFRVSEL